MILDEQAEQMLLDQKQADGIYQFFDERGGFEKVEKKYRSESILPKDRAPFAPRPPPPMKTPPPPVNLSP